MPLLWISLAFLCGILLAANLSLPLFAWIVLILIAITLLLPPIYNRLSPHLPSSFTRISTRAGIPSPVLVPLIILFFSMGVIRYQLALPKINSAFIAFYNDQPTQYILDGILVDPPDVRDTYVNLHIRINQLHSINASQFIPVHGLLLARVSLSPSFSYGDRIRLQGHLLTPPENKDFSYRDYLANRGIYSYMPYPSADLLQQGQGNPVYAALYTFRQHALNLLYSLLPDPEASLMAGILLGVQSGISQEVQQAFRLTGTSHIIVISGFNITIVAALFTFFFSRLLGDRRGAFVSVLGIIFYTLLVGVKPAAVRTAFLSLPIILGHQFGLNSLAFVAVLIASFTHCLVGADLSAILLYPARHHALC